MIDNKYNFNNIKINNRQVQEGDIYRYIPKDKESNWCQDFQGKAIIEEFHIDENGDVLPEPLKFLIIIDTYWNDGNCARRYSHEDKLEFLYINDYDQVNGYKFVKYNEKDRVKHCRQNYSYKTFLVKKDAKECVDTKIKLLEEENIVHLHNINHYQNSIRYNLEQIEILKKEKNDQTRI